MESADLLFGRRWPDMAGPMTHRRPAIFAGLLFASAAAGCAVGQAPTGEASGSPSVTVVVIARDLAFDPQISEVPSGVVVGIAFDNRDPGILHNISLVSTSGVVVFRGETFAGLETRTYLVAPLEGGDLRLICDVHPTMTASLRAAP